MACFFTAVCAGASQTALMAEEKSPSRFLFCRLRSGMEIRMTNCEACAYFTYDEDYECYVCEMDLDEDEMVRFLSSSFDACPYYQPGDEYRIVRRQM